MQTQLLDPGPLRPTGVADGSVGGSTDGSAEEESQPRERIYGCSDLKTAFAAADALRRLGVTAEADIGVAGWPSAVRVWVEPRTTDAAVVRLVAESVGTQMTRAPMNKNARVSVQVLAARSARGSAYDRT